MIFLLLLFYLWYYFQSEKWPFSYTYVCIGSWPLANLEALCIGKVILERNITVDIFSVGNVIEIHDLWHKVKVHIGKAIIEA